MQQWHQCPNCGAQVAFGVRFCANCGTQLNWPKQQQPPYPPHHYQQQIQSPPFYQQQQKEAVNPEVFKKPVSPEAFTLILLNLTRDVVKGTSQNLHKYLDAHEHSKLTQVEDELFLFYVFLLDYCWTTESKRTQEEQRIVRQAFEAHLANIVSLDTFQERLTAYAQIVTEEKDSTTMFLALGRKLSDFCGMPNAFFLVLVPSLYTMALQTVLALKSVRLKLK